jgi:hypothetical protein
MMKRGRSIALIVLALGMLFLGAYGMTQAAVRTAGTGPEDALPVPDGWQTLTSGQQTWYAFNYSGDKSQVLVQLSASPAGSASFAVWSPTEEKRRSQGYAATAAGSGTANALYGGDLVWAGSSGYSGTWYVVVEPSGSAQTWFSLKVSGNGVTAFQTAQSGPAETPTPSALTAVQAVLATVQAEAGVSAPIALATSPVTVQQAAALPTSSAAASSSDGSSTFHPYTPTPAPKGQNVGYDALPFPNGWQSLGVRQHVWYAFEYAGDQSQITIQLHAEPQGSAKFTVWSPDVLQRWVEGYFYTPTGMGSASSVYNGDLIWSGENKIRGTWYVEVEQTGNAVTNYTIQVSGSSVSTTVPPTPAPTPTYSIPMPDSGY